MDPLKLWESESVRSLAHLEHPKILPSAWHICTDIYFTFPDRLMENRTKVKVRAKALFWLSVKAAGLPVSLFAKPSEEHLRYEKKIQTGPDSGGSLRTFHPNKESGHRGERRSWEQAFHADMWETSQGRLTSFTAWAFFLVSGVSIVRAAANEIHQPCADTATHSIWEYFLLQLFKHQSRRDPFESVLWHISVNLQGVTLKVL